MLYVIPRTHSSYNQKFVTFDYHLPMSPTHQPLATTNLLFFYEFMILLLNIKAQLLRRESLLKINLSVCFPPGCMRIIQTQGVGGREKNDGQIYINDMRRNWCQKWMICVLQVLICFISFKLSFLKNLLCASF